LAFTKGSSDVAAVSVQLTIMADVLAEVGGIDSFSRWTSCCATRQIARTWRDFLQGDWRHDARRQVDGAALVFILRGSDRFRG
jgi:hypothetical protein